MPVSFLTERERERLRRFPTQIPPEDISTYFTLSESDLAHALIQRGNHNRLGFALQLCALRYLGFAPDDLSSAPDHVVAYVAQQLAVSPDVLPSYGGRVATRSAHFQETQTQLGFRRPHREDLRSLTAWLVERALEHDTPTLLFQVACERLYGDKLVRPGVTRLEQIVATARNQARQETFRRLRPLLTEDRRRLLDRVWPKRVRAVMRRVPQLELRGKLAARRRHRVAGAPGGI